MFAVVFAAALSLVGHNNSEGSSRFVVDEHGKIAITLQLLELDMPELCDVDFAGSDAVADNEDRLSACVRAGLPSWLRLRVGDEACTIVGDGWRRLSALQLVVEGTASCGRPVGRALTIDWGLFASKELEHVNSAVVVMPDGRQQKAMFARRYNKLVVELADPRHTRALVAGAVVGAVVVVVFVGAVIAAIVKRGRLRRRARSG